MRYYIHNINILYSLLCISTIYLYSNTSIQLQLYKYKTLFASPNGLIFTFIYKYKFIFRNIKKVNLNIQVVQMEMIQFLK